MLQLDQSQNGADGSTEPQSRQPASLAGPLDMAKKLSQKHETLLKYFLIGGAASALDVLIFFVLFNLVGTTALMAHSISVPTAVLFSFVTNARHNFRVNDYMKLRLASFVVVCTIGYLAGYGVIVLAANVGLGENIGKFLSLPVVFIIQYVLNSKITFRRV